MIEKKGRKDVEKKKKKQEKKKDFYLTGKIHLSLGSIISFSLFD